MSSLAARRAADSVPSGAFAVMAVGGAALFGVLLAARPAWAAGLLGLVVFLSLLAVSVVAALAVWIPVMFLKSVPGLATTCTLILICGVWAGGLLAGRASLDRLLPGRRFLVGALAVLIVWLALSVAWATDAAMAWSQLRYWLMAVALLVVIATSVSDARQVKLLLAAFVAGAVISVVVGALGAGPHLSASDLGSARGRFRGAEGNPNDLAAQLVPAIVLAVVLATGRRRPAVRWALVAAVAGLVVALGATQSRGALLAAAVVALAAVIAYRRRRARVALVLLPLVVLATATIALSPGAANRVTGFGDGGDGRTTEWQVALRMADAHPITGVGLNNFRVVGGDYVDRPGLLLDVGRIVDQPHVAHSTYLGLLAETGVVGLAAYLAVVAACLAALGRAARVFARAGEGELEILSWGILLAALAGLVVQFFQSNATDVRVWLLLALGPALATIASRTSSRPPTT